MLIFWTVNDSPAARAENSRKRTFFEPTIIRSGEPETYSTLNLDPTTTSVDEMGNDPAVDAVCPPGTPVPRTEMGSSTVKVTLVPSDGFTREATMKTVRVPPSGTVVMGTAKMLAVPVVKGTSVVARKASEAENAPSLSASSHTATVTWPSRREPVFRTTTWETGVSAPEAVRLSRSTPKSFALVFTETGAMELPLTVSVGPVPPPTATMVKGGETRVELPPAAS